MFSSKPPATVGDTKSHTPPKNDANVMEGLVNTFKRNPSSTSHDASDVSIHMANRKFAMQTFVDTTKVALDVLGELADIHPAIKAAVVAFKLVVTLDLKRRDNDDKVQALKVEMQSMMAVFLQLKDHPDPSTFYDDKYLQNLVLEIKEAIEIASSFCDYYMKKSVMRRCLKSFIYENHFTTYAQTFYDLGVRLHRQLSVHATWGIYTTLEHSKTLETQMDDIKSQLKSLFSLLATDREKELQKIIDSSGGANACVNSEASLQELIKASSEEFERDGKQQLKQSLQDELSESLDKALQQNLAVFQGKLALQLREIDLSISRESNRIITALSGGHEQIIDKDTREIWRDMGWKSRVKARNFVFALRDFYHGASHQQGDAHHRKPASPTGDHDNDSDAIATQLTGTDDRWALYYINVSFLQPIAEAIDDDGSSFITTREINDFIIMKPEGCSALQWLAFWAAGWHSSVSQYVDKIYRLLRKFHRLREKVRYENLEIYDMYLHHGSFNRLHQLLRSTTRSTAYMHPELATFRDKFAKAEEQKLLENLETVSFHVDSAATVELITGPYRIERYIYPLIYVLLERHLKIIQLGRLHTLNINEFDNKISSLSFIFQVFGHRMRDLSAVFQQINISPESHFTRYAFGMFHTLYVAKDSRENDTTTLNAWESLPKEAGEDDDIEICPLDISVDILQYKRDHPSEFDRSFMNTDLLHPDYNSGPLYGSWSAVLYDRFDAPVYGIFNVVLQPSVPQPETEKRWGTGTASSRSGSHEVQYSVYPKHPETQYVAISIVFFGGWLHFLGRFNELASSISGTWVNASTSDVSRENFTEILENHFQGVFVFSRTPPSLVRFRYTPSALEESPAKARWNFVKQSILFIIRRDTLDRKYVTTTLKEWRRFVELNIMFFAKDLSEDEHKDLFRLENCLPPSIAFSLYNMAVHLRRSLLTHRVYCDGLSCHGSKRFVTQTRYICITCWGADLPNTIDLCFNCREETLTSPRLKTHIISHSLIRINCELHPCFHSATIQKARDISPRIKEQFRAQDIPSCTICNEKLSLPCWACIDCATERLVCTPCDLKHHTLPPRYKIGHISASQFERAHGYHAMIWIRDDVEVNISEIDQLTRLENHVDRVGNLIGQRLGSEDKPDIDSRLDMLEKRFAAVEERIDSIDGRLAAFEKRFDSLEMLLRRGLNLANPGTSSE